MSDRAANPKYAVAVQCYQMCIVTEAWSSSRRKDNVIQVVINAMQNRTTIEMYEKMYVTPWPYDKGWRRNFEEVFVCSVNSAATILPMCIMGVTAVILSARHCTAQHATDCFMLMLCRCLVATGGGGGFPHTRSGRRRRCWLRPWRPRLPRNTGCSRWRFRDSHRCVSV